MVLFSHFLKNSSFGHGFCLTVMKNAHVNKYVNQIAKLIVQMNKNFRISLEFKNVIYSVCGKQVNMCMVVCMAP